MCALIEVTDEFLDDGKWSLANGLLNVFALLEQMATDSQTNLQVIISHLFSTPSDKLSLELATQIKLSWVGLFDPLVKIENFSTKWLDDVYCFSAKSKISKVR